MKVNLIINVPNWLDFLFACPLLAYRLVRFGYTFRRIYVGEGKYAIVDQKDFYRLNKLEWLVKEDYDSIYAVRFFRRPGESSKLISMHRFICNPPAGLLIDHINCNGLDNRRDNLRLATHSQNNCNRPKRKNTTSRFVGVHFAKKMNKWAAQIKYRGGKKWLGYFDNETDAAKAFDAAARKYHGEFARLNFPESADSVQRVAYRAESKKQCNQ
ncbi:MAG: HNH endonuclease [Sedimentisphaerales bacterium]